ncbi:hypothetical protein ACS0TY_033134 [Phlomoides rotata]
MQAAEECTSVLELDHKHTGALMLRAQTLVTLKEYHSALFDVNRLIELNPSSEVYKNLLARLRTQLSLAPIPEDEAEFEEDDECLDEVNQEGNEEEENENVEHHESRVNDASHNAAIENNERSSFENVNLKDETLPSGDQIKQQSDQQSSGWRTIPKPKGHSHLDYSRWDSVQIDSSEDDDDDDDDEDDDDDPQPQYRFRVKTVGVRAVK